MKRRLSALCLILMAASLTACAIVPLVARGQCAGGRCYAPQGQTIYFPAPAQPPVVQVPLANPIQPAQPAVASEAPGWYPLFEKPWVLGLWAGNTYFGKLDPETGEWTEPNGRTVNIKDYVEGKRPDSGKVGKAKPDCACPGGCACEKPCLCARGAAGSAASTLFDGRYPNYGMDWHGAAGGTAAAKKERWTINGKEASADQVLKKMHEGVGGPGDPPAGPGLTDDSTLPFVTVIGAEADRKRVLQDLETNPTLAAWKGKVRVQSYDPEHWAAKPFAATVSPTVCFQSPSGQVLDRMNGYDGPASLALNLEDVASRLRNPQPYDPHATPDASRPPLLPTLGKFDPTQYPGACALLGGTALLGLHLLVRKKGSVAT